MRRLGLFARRPAAGSAKTRLSPALPPALAAWLYEAMLEDTFSAMRQARADQRLVFWAGEPGRSPPDFATRVQQGRDLGERLAAAFDDLLFATGDHALVLGSDAPALTPAHIDAAFAQLERQDVVLGPAADGGYWCVGLTFRTPELFEDIPWSTPGVLARTLQRAHEAVRSVSLTAPLEDLDTPADLARLVGARAAEADSRELGRGIPRERGPRTPGPAVLGALVAMGLAPDWATAGLPEA
jgi:rSAM/selenodomain-associated transferase 1